MKIPASIRNNNPGAMEPGPSSRKFGSESHQVLTWRDSSGVLRTNKCATFDDPVSGAAAQFDLLASKNYTGRSIQQAIAKWCGGFSVTTYIKALEASGIVTRDTNLTRDLLLNPEVAIPIARSMAWHEAGREFPLDEAGWRAAHTLAFGTAAAAASAAAGQAGGQGAASTLAASPKEPPAATFGAAELSEPPVVKLAPAGPLKNSGTFWGVNFAGLGATLNSWAETVATFGLDWVASVSTLKPVQGLAEQVLGNTKTLSQCIIAYGLTLVITRRVKAKEEGKKG